MNYEAKVAITLLLKGLFYKSDHENAWQELLYNSTGLIKDYFQVINLDVEIDEVEAYAYLKNSPVNEDEEALPKLINSRELNYKTSLLCVLLRKRIVDFEMQNETQRAVVSKEEIVGLLQLFLPQKVNEVKLLKEIETTIKKVEELGFLKKLKKEENVYEIKSAIKAFVDAQWLNVFTQRLEEYKEENLWN